MDSITGKGQLNGLQDARRHVVWSALLSRNLGISLSLCLLALHEINDNVTDNLENIFSKQNPKSLNATYMDFFNNALGVMIGHNFKGSEEEMIEHIEEKIFMGEFIIVNKSNEFVPSSKLFRD